MASESKITITNIRQVEQHLKNLDIMNKKNLAAVRVIMKKPFLKMRSDSRKNLIAQKSIKSGNLLRGLSVGSKFSKSKGYITVAFGGRATKASNRRKGSQANHFHLVNSGTIRRRHKSGKFVGAVGEGSTRAKNMNPSFKVGFADRAIKARLSTVGPSIIKDFEAFIKTIKTQGV